MAIPFPVAALAPFFDETIVVEGKRKHGSGTRSVRGTFNACVFDNGFADPFAEADAESNVRTFSVSVRAGDWIERTHPQLGDRITFNKQGSTINLAVSRVESLLGDIWALTAREVV